MQFAIIHTAYYIVLAAANYTFLKHVMMSCLSNIFQSTLDKPLFLLHGTHTVNKFPHLKFEMTKLSTTENTSL